MLFFNHDYLLFNTVIQNNKLLFMKCFCVLHAVRGSWFRDSRTWCHWTRTYSFIVAVEIPMILWLQHFHTIISLWDALWFRSNSEQRTSYLKKKVHLTLNHLDIDLSFLCQDLKVFIPILKYSSTWRFKPPCVRSDPGQTGGSMSQRKGF